MKKIIKNKFVILTICIIIVSILYFAIQKAIDNYSFENNKEIVTETEEVFYEENKEVDSTISDEETNLVLEEESNEEIKQESEEEVSEKIYIYVTGEVNIPGVVILNKGSRIVDAINAAGGTTSKADISKVNLVYVLDDGMKVNIPNNTDLKDNTSFEYITMNSGDRGEDDYVSDNNEKPSSKSSNIVNINTATQTELETLPGIGPSLALKIINYRKENGKFSSIEQLKEVSGIGDSKFERLRKYVTI